MKRTQPLLGPHLIPVVIAAGATALACAFIMMDFPLVGGSRLVLAFVAQKWVDRAVAPQLNREQRNVARLLGNLSLPAAVIIGALFLFAIMPHWF